MSNVRYLVDSDPEAAFSVFGFIQTLLREESEFVLQVSVIVKTRQSNCFAALLIKFTFMFHGQTLLHSTTFNF